MLRHLAILLLLLLPVQAAAQESLPEGAAPRHGGTMPNIGIRLGDPSNFEVVAPLDWPVPQTMYGETDILILQNLSEAYKILTANPLPSSWAGPYTLDIDTSDRDGEAASRTVRISYDPPVVEVATAINGVIEIPALTHAFRDQERRHALTSAPMIDSNGELLKGNHEVLVSLHPNSTVALTVGGRRVNPGDRNIRVGAYNFTGTQGVLALPVGGAADLAVGQARLLVMTTAPGTPILDVVVKTWVPEVTLDAVNWTPQQGLETVDVTVRATPASKCALTNAPDAAKASNIPTAPLCLVEFQPRPAGLTERPGEPYGLTGRIWQAGPQPVGYELYLVDVTGTKVPFISGSRIMDVVPAMQFLEYRVERDSDEAFLNVEPVEAHLVQTGGPTCDTFFDFPGNNVRSTPEIIRCVVRWTSLPTKLAQDTWWPRPRLTGTLQARGIQTVGYQVYMVTPAGDFVLGYEGSFDYRVIDPPAPVVSEEMLDTITPGLYAVSRDGGFAGTMVVKGANADMRVRLDRDGELLVDETYYTLPFGRDNYARKRMNAPAAPLWTQMQWNVQASYRLLPDIVTEKTITTVSVPNEYIKPEIQVDSTKMLDTEPLTIGVQIKDIYRPELGYDPTLMGEWRIRLVRYSGVSNVVPLTDYVDAPGGEASFSLDAASIGLGSIRISAQAELIAPLPDYVRTAFSSRPVVLTILKGGPLEAAVTTRRLTGEAPFTTIFAANLEVRNDQLALGDVMWQISADEGNSWQDHAPGRTNKMRLVHTFKKGEYLVRARIMNRNSGVEFVTETVQVIAYDVPEVRIKGPEHIFIGDTGNYALTVSNDGVPLSAGDVAVEWSLDRGKTFEEGGLTFSVTREEEERMLMVTRVRMRDAPVDDPNVWRNVRSRVVFAPVRPPAVRIFGPSRVELGQVGQFRGIVRAPYRNMDVEITGEWTLPNGDVVPGTDLAWGPTADELPLEVVSMTHTARITGHEAFPGSHKRRIRIWEYRWPEFRVDVARQSQYAPNNVTLRLRAINQTSALENPLFEWTLPEGIPVLEQSSPAIRVIRTEMAGEYPLVVRASDGRGNVSVVESTVTMLEPPQHRMNLRVAKSNPYDRAPLDIIVRPEVSGGHPADRILRLRYFVNGQLTPVISSFGRFTLPQGVTTVGIEADTEMGFTVSGQTDFNVVANVIPTCKMTRKEWFGGWVYNARCSDVDGRVVRHSWLIDGADAQINGAQISVSRSGRSGEPAMQVIATDDAGDQSVPVSPPPVN